MSGRSQCWTSYIKFEDCCNFYNSAKTVPNIPCWQDASGPKREVELQLAGRKWRLAQKLVAPYTNDNHELAPYVLWPSAFVLAAWLLGGAGGDHVPTEQPAIVLAGKRAVELGCGLALPSLAAAYGGANSLATDVDHRSLALAAKAAARNLPAAANSRFETSFLDFRDRAALQAIGAVDLLLIAGQFYREELREPLVSAVCLLCSQGCTLLMSNWVGEHQQEPMQLFLTALDDEAFELQEHFDCSERGYAHPHAQYLCAMLVRPPPS